jgi:hypothetical protein
VDTCFKDVVAPPLSTPLKLLKKALKDNSTWRQTDGSLLNWETAVFFRYGSLLLVECSCYCRKVSRRQHMMMTH